MSVKAENGSITEKPQNELVFVPDEDGVKLTVNRLSGGRRIFAVTDENVAKLHPGILPRDNIIVLPAGEDSKTLDTAEKVCRAMLSAGMNRSCIVVAFGGGVVGDIAGFAASVFMRGVDFINVPTTLLSQVDSAIGGKTGVNLDGYKNMIGAFKMPSHVVICPQLLSTLPNREWRCGMGELVKTALLDCELYNFVSDNIDGLNNRDVFAVEKAVKGAASFKKKITDEDPTEKGNRKILNLGHTVGHALEKSDNHALSHGEYVMLGIKAELIMTEHSRGFSEKACLLLDSAGCPGLINTPPEEVCEIAKTDKKNGNKIVVIGLMDAGKPYTCEFSAAEFTERYRTAVSRIGGVKNV